MTLRERVFHVVDVLDGDVSAPVVAAGSGLQHHRLAELLDGVAEVVAGRRRGGTRAPESRVLPAHASGRVCPEWSGASPGRDGRVRRTPRRPLRGRRGRRVRFRRSMRRSLGASSRIASSSSKSPTIWSRATGDAGQSGVGSRTTSSTPSGDAASASIRPSCPPPTTPRVSGDAVTISPEAYPRGCIRFANYDEE